MIMSVKAISGLPAVENDINVTFDNDSVYLITSVTASLMQYVS